MDINEVTQTVYKVGEHVFNTHEDADRYIKSQENVRYYLVRSGVDTKGDSTELHNKLLVMDDGLGSEPLEAHYVREYVRVLLGYDIISWAGDVVSQDTMVPNFEFQKLDTDWINHEIKKLNSSLSTMLYLTDDEGLLNTEDGYDDINGLRCIYIQKRINVSDIKDVRSNILAHLIY